MHLYVYMFFFKQKTAYEMRISDWSSDVCSSDLWYSASRLMSDLPEKTGQLLTDMGPILCRKIGRRDTLRVSNPFYPLPHSLSRQWAIIKPQPILADLALQLDQASEPGRNDGTKTGKRQQGRTAVHKIGRAHV